MFTERPREVTARHLNGEAAVYGRQSTKKQDEENQGSLEFQRAQRRYAEGWGVPDERIVPYEDRGLTGAASEHRPRFLAMLDGIKAGRITMVFASDQSRLARNAIEWFKFLNLCRAHDVLLVLNGRIIRLNDGGDGFSSRIVALVDEYDLETRRGHVLRGIEGRLKDEKAVTAPPTGYIAAKEKERKGEWDLDPDPAVQTAIYTIFRIFPEERSCARTVRRLVAEGIQIPARKPGKDLNWVSPSIMAVRRFLKNRAYSGDYPYRQRICDPTRGRNKYGHWRVRVATREEMRVILDHHVPYISRERFNEIQEILKKNAPSKMRRNLGPGSALLQGILCCGRHEERSLGVEYKESLRDGRNGAHYFHCLGFYEAGGGRCVAIPGRPLDLAVAKAVFDRLTRPSLETIKAEWEIAKRTEMGAQDARKIALEREEHRVRDLRAHLALINPALRDLAEDFEVQLNEALGNIKRMRGAAAAEPAEDTFFTNDAFEELSSLCEDLPALFYAATTAHRDRKEVVRTLVQKVIVQGRTEETVTAVVHWTDGAEPTVVEARLLRFAHRLIREFAAQGLGNSEIAKRLNEMGILTSHGKPWTNPTVWTARFGKGRYRRDRRGTASTKVAKL